MRHKPTPEQLQHIFKTAPIGTAWEVLYAHIIEEWERLKAGK